MIKLRSVKRGEKTLDWWEKKFNPRDFFIFVGWN